MASLKDRLSEVLLANKLLTQEQLNEAIKLHSNSGQSLQNVLIDQGIVKDQDLLSAFSQSLGIPAISLSRMRLDPALKQLIPREMAKQYELVPVGCLGQVLTVAMADPSNVFALDTITAMTGLTINPLLATPKDVQQAIDLYYGTGVEETLQEIAKESQEAVEVIEAKQTGGSAADQLMQLSQEVPVVKTTDAILLKAVQLRASDLLVEPMETKMRIRYRVDGVLQDAPSPPKTMHEGIVSRIKVITELNIAEHRLPQDGHFGMTIDDRKIDFRVSILPASFGEKVCIRVLDKGLSAMRLDDLSFSKKDLETLKRCAERPHGLILVTGPTGSGKTTTLYAMLDYIDRPEKNLVTVEDPVEYQLNGVNQVNARPEVGLTFGSALRAILRQDPDVIMVGEIRDSETADMAIKSALTGHLVLSTLHTNDATGTIVRMINMGVQPFLLNSCLTLVIAQRLVRKICERCKKPFQPSERMAAELGLLDDKGQPVTIAKGEGCTACRQSGYKGREVISEVLLMTPEIRELVLRGAPERDIEQAARRAGMRSIRDNGLQRVIAQSTTVDEVFRTTVGEQVGA
jgi:type IV pilus assembly protein PilB